MPVRREGIGLSARNNSMAKLSTNLSMLGNSTIPWMKGARMTLNAFQFSFFSNSMALLSKNFLEKSLKLPLVSKLAIMSLISRPKSEAILFGVGTSPSLGNELWSFNVWPKILSNSSLVGAN